MEKYLMYVDRIRSNGGCSIIFLKLIKLNLGFSTYMSLIITNRFTPHITVLGHRYHFGLWVYLYSCPETSFYASSCRYYRFFTKKRAKAESKMLCQSHSIMKPPLLLLSFLFVFVGAQVNVPPKQDGFWYQNRPAGLNSTLIEAFFDPVCPDSRDAWPPLKQALHHYASRVSLVVHPFPLPYHDNAFISSRALHVINKLNASATYSLLEAFFKQQEGFYNKATFNVPKASVLDQIVKLTTIVAGNSLSSAVKSGFSDNKTDQATRVSFKYGCLRGVYGTPFFFVNGFPLPDAGSAIDYDGWIRILKPLVASGRAVNS